MIQQKIQNPLALELLKRDAPEGTRVRVDYVGEHFTFERVYGPAEEPVAEMANV